MKSWHYHVISNTHWDREWRYPFQVYRVGLVSMMDSLLLILEQNQDYRVFFLDSQTVILEDYLEIRPENKKRIAKMVRADRLQIGPWYTLPDQWCCPGEALVRNLLMGHRVARSFGPVSKLGYTPFSNGQISQLPQIYNGFGIDSCFFYRGVGKHVAKPEFLWEGADGSRVFAFRFGDYARYNYYYLVYRPGLLGRSIRDRDYVWNPEEIPFHVASDTFQDRQYGWMNQKLFVHEEKMEGALEDVKKFTKPDTATGHLLFMMGHDHSFALDAEVDLIKALQKHLDPGEELIHSSLKDYMDAFRKEAKDLEILKGEMRHTNRIGLWTNLFAQILSCRTYIKQQNAQVNAKVLYGAEPLAALAWITGSEYPAPFFEIAWKKLLVNQAHDAVGGCSADPVHREMQARWSEVEALSDEISRNAMRDLALRIDGSSISPHNLQITVFNPLPYMRSVIARFILDIPGADPNTTFVIENIKGARVPFQILSRESATPSIEGEYELSMPFPVQRFHTCLYLEHIPEMGYEVFVIKPGEKPSDTQASLVLSNWDMENEFLKIHVNDNGTFRIADKRSGRIMNKLCFYEDEGELGDPWNNMAPDNETPVRSLDVQAHCSILHSGHLQGTLKIEFNLPIPSKVLNDKTRSGDLADIPIELFITLKKHSPLVEIEIELDNRAENHRLRVLFPSGLTRAEYSYADGQFDVLKRPIKLPDPAGWKEPPYPTHPLWNFVDVSDGEQGLAVINNGLIEYEVRDDTDRTICITLLRTFGAFVYGRPTPEAQCLGKHRYALGILPHKGYWHDTDIFARVADMVAPLQALESAPTKGSLPSSCSFLRVSPSLVFSGVKQGEDGKSLVIRLWNPLDRDQEVFLESCIPLEKVRLLTLAEKPIRKLKILENKKVAFSAGGKKIVTLGIHFGPSLAIAPQ